MRKTLLVALGTDIFAISNTRPSETFLSKCTFLDQVDHDVSGAKVVAVVDRSANVAQAASIVGSSRTIFKGKSSYAPDIVLVNEFVADDFIFHLTQAVTSPVSRSIPSTFLHPLKEKTESHSSIVKELEKIEGYKLVMSGANGSIVEIRDR
jgi:aldehyde dehydrogenase (NAD+)